MRCSINKYLSIDTLVLYGLVLTVSKGLQGRLKFFMLKKFLVPQKYSNLVLKTGSSSSSSNTARFYKLNRQYKSPSQVK